MIPYRDLFSSMELLLSCNTFNSFHNWITTDFRKIFFFKKLTYGYSTKNEHLVNSNHSQEWFSWNLPTSFVNDLKLLDDRFRNTLFNLENDNFSFQQYKVGECNEDNKLNNWPNIYGIDNVLVYSMDNSWSNTRSFFIFINTLYDQRSVLEAKVILDWMIPHLHIALCRVMVNLAVKSDVSLPLYINQKKNLLTDREKEILYWLCKGKTNSEIASILSIHYTTVKNHVKNLLVKLQVNNRCHAASKALSLGLVPMI